MKFPLVTLGDLQFGLLLFLPEAEQGRLCTVDHTFGGVTATGRTGLDERRPTVSALRLRQRTRLQLVGSEADDWQKGLAALGPRLVAQPLWADALPAANWGDRIYEPGYVLNFDSESDAYLIYAAADLPATPALPWLAPLLLGLWTERPELEALTPKVAQLEVTLAERGPWAWRIGVRAAGTGAWEAVPDWSEAPTIVSDYPLEQVELGAAREIGLDRVNVAPRWRQEATFQFAGPVEIRTALSTFAAVKGPWGTFALPAWMQPGADTPGTPSTYTAAFAGETLAIDYVAGRGLLATARIAFLQELASTRTQSLPPEVHLYRLAYEADPTHPELYADYDAPITGPEGTFLPLPIEGGELRLSLKPQDERAEITVLHRPGSLAADWMIERLYYPVSLTIWSCDPANVAARTLKFSGAVRSIAPDGIACTITAALFAGALERDLLRWRWQAVCNARLGDSHCGLDINALSSTGTLARANLTSGNRTVRLLSVTGWGGPTYAEGLFARGWLLTGTGRGAVKVRIQTSVMDGTTLVLTVDRPIWPDLIAEAGQACTLQPGCDGQAGTCQTRFDNFAPATPGRGFRGEPYMPDYIESRSVETPTASK